MTRILLIACLFATPVQDAKRGKKLFESRKCASCHAPGKEAADLFKEGPLWSAGWYAAYFTDPSSLRPASDKMPYTSLSRRDKLDLAAYLMPFQTERMRNRSADMNADLAPPKKKLREKETRILYVKHCSPCHGPDGKGDGTLAAQFEDESQPRNFVRGIFRRKNADERDIFLTLTLGMPGSGMGSFEHLSRDERWALARYVLSLSPFEQEKRDPVPDPPKATAEMIRAGEDAFFAMGCRTCHGGDLKGRNINDTVFDWKDEDGRPLPSSRDLTSGIFTTGSDPKSVYRTILDGRGGTPMPAFKESLTEEKDRWALVVYIRSQFDPDLKAMREKDK